MSGGEGAPAPLSFSDFLEKMKDPAAADLVRNIKGQVGLPSLPHPSRPVLHSCKLNPSTLPTLPAGSSNISRIGLVAIQ